MGGCEERPGDRLTCPGKGSGLGDWPFAGRDVVDEAVLHDPVPEGPRSGRGPHRGELVSPPQREAQFLVGRDRADVRRRRVQ